MKIAVYPGSFDPITNGHLDILARAASIFDIVHIAVATNLNKAPLFTAQERYDLIVASVTPRFTNVKIACFDGLVVDYAREVGANVIIRGLRAVSDFEFEFQMALMNRHLDAQIDTIFLMPAEEYTYLSSSTVKEIARFGGDVTAFVPEPVKTALLQKMRR